MLGVSTKTLTYTVFYFMYLFKWSEPIRQFMLCVINCKNQPAKGYVVIFLLNHTQFRLKTLPKSFTIKCASMTSLIAVAPLSLKVCPGKQNATIAAHGHIKNIRLGLNFFN